MMTEKSVLLESKRSQYTFQVDIKANKVEIKKAIESMYGVSVESINTLLTAGKRKTRNTKSGFIQGKRSNYKKAIVRLKAGETIDLYGNA